MLAFHFFPYQFVTLRTSRGAPLLAQAPMKQLLLNCFTETKKRYKLTVAGYVVLDDHAHFLFNVPAEFDCASVMNDLRAGFQRAWRKSMPVLERDAPNAFREEDIEYHSTYESEELRAYLDFIHYDPVRHGLATRPADYIWSSLPARIAQGHYPETWAEVAPPAAISRVIRECVAP